MRSNKLSGIILMITGALGLALKLLYTLSTNRGCFGYDFSFEIILVIIPISIFGFGFLQYKLKE